MQPGFVPERVLTFRIALPAATYPIAEGCASFVRDLIDRLSALRGVMTVGDERQEVAAGDAIYVPHGQRHTLANTGNEPIKLLLVCGPAFFYEDEVLDTNE